MALRRLPSIATRSPALLSAPPRTMLLTRADVGRPMAGRWGLLDQGRRMAHYDPYAAQNDRVRATTILCVRKGGQAVMIGDGQVSQGNFVMKGNARKVKRLGADKHKVVAGMAGSTADAMALFERLEEKLEKYPGQLLRAAVELTKDWRRDKYLRNLEASMLVADSKMSIMITGNGDVIEPEGESSQNVISIGSGGLVARSAALALLDMDLTAEEIARKAMKIAGDTCVFTNHTHIVEVIKDEDQSG